LYETRAARVNQAEAILGSAILKIDLPQYADSNCWMKSIFASGPNAAYSNACFGAAIGA
jgi:hypothetical protein